jgi:HK97 family phage portal protein
MWPFPRKRHDPDETKDWTLESNDAAFLALFGAGAPTASGESVGPHSALRVPAFAGAARTIAETVASLPIGVYKRLPDNARELDPNHPAHKVLESPTPWSSTYEFMLELVFDSIMHGRGVAVAARAHGQVRELHRLFSTQVQRQRDPSTGEPSYLVNAGQAGIERRYSWQDTVYIAPLPAIDFNTEPMSLVSAAREAIGLASVLSKHGARLFANGARPSGVLSVKGKLSELAAKRIRAAWESVTGGERSGGTAVLEEGTTWSQLTLNSVDAQFLELRKFQVLEIVRVLRVPPHFVAEMERATHANAEELALQFVAYCVKAWTDLIEGALSRVLFTDAERETHFLDFDFSDLVKPNTLQRLDAITKAVAGGVYVPNEGRAKENLPPKPGGDDLRVPLNTVIPGSPRDVTAKIDNAPPDPGASDSKPNLRAVA